MRKDGLSDLDAAHVSFGNVANDLSGFHYFTVSKGYGVTDRINLGDCISAVLFHLLRDIEQIVTYAENTSFAVDGLVVTDLKLNTSHRRLFLGKNNALKIEVLVGATEVLDLKSLNLNLLNQALIERIKSIKHVHEVVLCLVSGRIVDSEERVKVLQRILSYLTAHFLRLVHNDDRTVCSDNVNGLTRAEVISLGKDNTCFLTFSVFLERCGKRLRVNDHNVDACA